MTNSGLAIDNAYMLGPGNRAFCIQLLGVLKKYCAVSVSVNQL